jgi:hypothetical protein
MLQQKPGTHYQALGCSRTASQAELKAAFQAAALRLHPDKQAASSEGGAAAAAAAQQQYQWVQEAWQVGMQIAWGHSTKRARAACHSMRLHPLPLAGTREPPCVSCSTAPPTPAACPATGPAGSTATCCLRPPAHPAGAEGHGHAAG